MMYLITTVSQVSTRRYQDFPIIFKLPAWHQPRTWSAIAPQCGSSQSVLWRRRGPPGRRYTHLACTTAGVSDGSVPKRADARSAHMKSNRSTIPRAEITGLRFGVSPLLPISNGHAFENGQQFSAWLGLVPRKNSSGGKSRLMGITKRGDPYLRTLLIHGVARWCFKLRPRQTGAVSGLWTSSNGSGWRRHVLR